MSRIDGFHLTIEEDAATLLLRLEGDFDLSTIGRVETALDNAIGEPTRHVVFDLRDVSFVDMAGLMTLMRANERSHREAFDVQVVAPTGQAGRVFTLTSAHTDLTMVTLARR